MEKHMKACLFLCFHVKFKHESTKTCNFPCKFSFSAYFFHKGSQACFCVFMFKMHQNKHYFLHLVPPLIPPLHHNGINVALPLHLYTCWEVANGESPENDVVGLLAERL